MFIISTLGALGVLALGAAIGWGVTRFLNERAAKLAKEEAADKTEKKG